VSFLLRCLHIAAASTERTLAVDWAFSELAVQGPGMLTRLRVRNFKRFDEIDIELSESVVFVGPNNSGKTSALQALSLWSVGVEAWFSKRTGKAKPDKRPGVNINRRDLVAIPVPSAALLWRELHVREGFRTGTGKSGTKNIRIDVLVNGVSISNVSWECGFEFDYSNEESLFCRPLRALHSSDGKVSEAEFSVVPEEAREVQVAFLPPMSGLDDREFHKQQGEIAFLVGQGRTASVIRNLCYRVWKREKDTGTKVWVELTQKIQVLFGVLLEEPEYISDRGEIVMQYREKPGGVLFDLSSAGRGLQQTLLLLAQIYENPGKVLLLDEPDAHLELLRQRQTYQLLSELARQGQAQVIAASHSEVVLDEAAGRDTVVAFIGKPFRVAKGKSAQVRKSLNDIGFDQYLLAEQKGWVLYIEGSTDLSILRSLARRLSHPAADVLEQPFQKTVANQPSKARDHFHGLQAAKPDLVGIGVFDRLDKTDQALSSAGGLTLYAWKRREVENYLGLPESLYAFARGEEGHSLFSKTNEVLMRRLVAERVPPIALNDRSHPYWFDTKMSDSLLDELFETYYRELQRPNQMRKTAYHALAEFVEPSHVDPEVFEVLDQIVITAQKACPRE
jgi:ABC-type branched-subunit amino acid transport system ATPase component